MTRTAAEQDLDVFMSMINQNCGSLLVEGRKISVLRSVEGGIEYSVN